MVEATDPSDVVNSSDAHTSHGCEDGDNSHSENWKNEPGSKHQPGAGENLRSTGADEDGQPLRLDQILERYSQHPTVRMKPESTRKTYAYHFRRFAKHAHIEDFSRRQLAGPKGKRLLLDHVAALPTRSRRPMLSGLASVWKFGVNLPWPIDAEADIGKLPKTRRDLTPQDSTVKAWHERLQHESSPYLRTLWLLIAQFGLRPHTVARLRWSHIRYDENGIPCELRVNGADEGLKTYADVACYLPPDVIAALIELRESTKDQGEAEPILPWADGWGRVKHARVASYKVYAQHWQRLRTKYGLPKLRMKDLRHWVASECRDAGLPEQARAYMQGHEQPIGNMGEAYDNRPVEVNLARQAEKLPHGPLGVFDMPDVQLETSLPSDIVATLMGYHDGKVGFNEVLNRLEAWRMNANTEVARLEH